MEQRNYEEVTVFIYLLFILASSFSLCPSLLLVRFCMKYMSFQNSQDRRTSGGRYRGHGTMRGVDSGASQGSRLKAYINGNDQTKDNSQNIQNNPSKAISGRGPRRYRPSFKDNIDTAPPLNKQRQI